jgi:hypothetical protein
MASPELIQSWARSEGFLREARAPLPAEIAVKFSADLKQFEEFLKHDELGLALDCLQGIADEVNSVYSPRCSCTRRTARSRTSGEKLVRLVHGSIFLKGWSLHKSRADSPMLCVSLRPPLTQEEVDVHEAHQANKFALEGIAS